MADWLIYGANGYTGELAAREAVAQGLRPILAGRNGGAVSNLARELDLPSRVFPLEDPAAVRAGLVGVAAVLHCAGPFLHTSPIMVNACLATGAHYLDITGEMTVFESILSAKKADAATRAAIALLPGVGFDVVPSDCLATRLALALPGAISLTLAFAADGGSFSRGTARTMIENLPHVGAVRRNGKIVEVAAAHDAREIDFGGRLGKRWTMTIPWGDVSTAYHSTGIPNIQVFTGTPLAQIRRLRRLRPLIPLTGLSPIKRYLLKRVDKKVAGPGPEARAKARTYLWGEVVDGSGATATATLETPEAYYFTAVSALAAVREVLAGTVAPGAWTPSRAFGPDFVTRLPGVTAGEVHLQEEPDPPAG
ncbi:MAG TPA: saccharopine dehydrogenase NADP-binding domain-containing protein [Thermoanaerobaculia bacterium]|nr:saccharopine dehydrogenase NADP-binding domain-containing protein [Thermoanaerobaculia bacterium]